MNHITPAMTPEEAEALDREENLARTPDERMQALLELRNAWIPADQRRIARIVEFVEIPLPSERGFLDIDC